MEPLRFSLENVTVEKFDDFIYKLRAAVRDPNGTSHGIPVLYKSVTDPKKRFILVELDNYDNEKITVPIDVLSLYVVGFLGEAGRDRQPCFYYLKQDNDTVPINTLFPGTKREEIPFTGNYPELEKKAGNRKGIPLGASPLNKAIQTLKGYHGKGISADAAAAAAAAAALLGGGGDSDLLAAANNPLAPIAESFLVIIQMVSEVARYGFIQRQLGVKINDLGFSQKPGYKTMSLENKWSALSIQIQRAPIKGGKFKENVVLKDANDKNVIISDVSTAIKFSDISLLHYESAAAAILQLQDSAAGPS